MKRLTVLLFLMLLAFVPKAQAQVSRHPLVAVLEVRIGPTVDASQTLSQRATEDVTQWVVKKLYADVVPHKDTERAIKDYGLHLPLNQSEIQLIGKRLGADRVVLSEVTKIEVRKKPHSSQVELSLSVIDVMTGELTGGGTTTGLSSGETKNTDDNTLIQMAIKKAINLFPLITNGSMGLTTATILSVKNASKVILNRGSRDGLHKGEEMIVVRGGRHISRIRVVSVDATTSWAIVTKAKEPILPEDQAIGVSDLEVIE